LCQRRTPDSRELPNGIRSNGSPRLPGLDAV
jgi:hypothetical protein